MLEGKARLLKFKMRFWLFILSFLVLYAAGGRKIAVPYGVAFTNNWVPITILTLILDSVQIFFFYHIYTKSAEKIRMLRGFGVKTKKKLKKSKVLAWAKNFGNSGVFILSMLPSFGGGIWSSVLLAFVLKTDKKISYLLILTGSLVGIAILAILSHGVIQSIINLIH